MQLSNPVRWLEIIEKLISFEVTDIAECGPGQILTGINKKITSDANCVSLGTYSSMHAFSQLCKNGHEIV
jgi:[acyl-carrier-protein] S-malonyltransferase